VSINQPEIFANFKQDASRDALLTDFARTTLKNRYVIPGETYQDAFARVAIAYADDSAHAERLYTYISKLWLVPSTPVITNGGTSDFTRWKLAASPDSYPAHIKEQKRGLTISCFLNEAEDSLAGIMSVWNENAWMSSNGGGIGTYWGNIRSAGMKIAGRSSISGGVIPFIKVSDSMTLAISQGSSRRGACAAYLPVSHPEIEEFVELRKPTGGDHNRRAMNLHHGVVITDDFMQAVEDGGQWNLIDPQTKEITNTISARALMARMLNIRIETGEPYMLFIDNVNRDIPDIQKKLGLTVKTSNLCIEITLPTGIDFNNKMRTAVCCLSSLNLSHFTEWEHDEIFIEDCVRFLDNVLEDFIQSADETLESAVYSAKRERSIGLGVLGWHDFLQSLMLPMEGAIARGWNNKIFKHIQERALAASVKLAHEKGPCLDAAEVGSMQRCSNVTASVPTASTSIIANTSPGIDPIINNAYAHKTLGGSSLVKNKRLEALLVSKGLSTEEVWNSVVRNEGSVQQLDCLSDDEKAVFRNAFEISQMALINLAADRQRYISQSQSLNLYCLSDIHKSDLLVYHMHAWARGVKSLYYLRSRSVQRVENEESASVLMNYAKLNSEGTESPLKYSECEACS
jgi:ribonucleoside-diphosphate reductase alpha chain